MCPSNPPKSHQVFLPEQYENSLVEWCKEQTKLTQPCGATKDPCVYNMSMIEKTFIHAYCEISCNFYIPYSRIICFHAINEYLVCGALFFGLQHEILDAHPIARKAYKQDIDLSLRLQTLIVGFGLN